ncbi:MAG: response regulator [Alphaproteobacteria bacterium]|nr:response regulator [Alphaproteobacteria bacterium]
MSIRTRLLGLVLLATLVPGLLGGLRFLLERENSVAAATESLATAAEAVAEDLDEKIRGTSQLLYGLARAGELGSGNRAACSRFLSDVREEYAQYTGILTIDPDGRLFCDSLQTGRELDLRDRDYFVKALVSFGNVTLQPAFGRLTGLSVLQIAYPARREDGQLRFVLLASLNLEAFLEIHQRKFPHAELLLLDRQGTVLAWLPRDRGPVKAGASISGSELFQFAESSSGASVGEVPGLIGGQKIWARAAPSYRHDIGIHVLVGQAKAELVAAANRRLLQELAVLAAVSALLFAGVWTLAELGIRRQVARIAGMARSLGTGDLAARIAPPYPGGELGELMQVLNDMAGSLEEQRRSIDELHGRLRQSQRLEAIGQLTGGIAHDFNNLLTVILGNSEMLARALDGEARLKALAELSVKAAERGAGLTAQLLAFARRQPLDPRAVDLNQRIAEMDPLLRRALGEHVEIELVRGAGLWRALVDPGQFENALLNLCLNARDAMPGGGRLTIETANAHIDAAYAARQTELEPGQYVMVAVSDTGSGMDAATIERAFEPFFSTKGADGGSGLGLSMVYGFVKQSRGHVRLYSEPGHGTTVRLYLPRADADAEPAAERPPERSEQQGHERILLVEDDELVREHVHQQLESLGYVVVAVGNGAAALEVLERGDSFDLLFTDVVMPGGLSGRELADRARQMRPGMPVLFTSGYTENAIVHHGRLDRGIHLLAKPYRREDLAAKVRKVLDEARGRA